MLTDTTTWTLVAQGATPTGARVVLHRTRVGLRYELVVGAGQLQSYTTPATAWEAFAEAVRGGRWAA
jgi:hypothetical protein